MHRFYYILLYIILYTSFEVQGPSAVQVADAELKGREPRPMLPTPQPEPAGKKTLLGEQNDSRLKHTKTVTRLQEWTTKDLKLEHLQNTKKKTFAKALYMPCIALRIP